MIGVSNVAKSDVSTTDYMSVWRKKYWTGTAAIDGTLKGAPGKEGNYVFDHGKRTNIHGGRFVTSFKVGRRVGSK